MEIKNLFADDSAVSPVIGVILMVAITVILAAVIGTFVLNLGSGLQQSAPQASFDFDYADDAYNVTITHANGDSIPGEQLNATISGSPSFNYAGSDTFESVYGSDSVTSGDSATYNLSESNWQGETVSVIWQSESGEESATLSRSSAPDS